MKKLAIALIAILIAPEAMASAWPGGGASGQITNTSQISGSLCVDGEILENQSGAWVCTTTPNPLGGTIAVQDGDAGTITADTTDFNASEFVVTASPAAEANVSIGLIAINKLTDATAVGSVVIGDGERFQIVGQPVNNSDDVVRITGSPTGTTQIDTLQVSLDSEGSSTASSGIRVTIEDSSINRNSAAGISVQNSENVGILNAGFQAFGTTTDGILYGFDASSSGVGYALNAGNNPIRVSGVDVDATEFALLNNRNATLIDTNDSPQILGAFDFGVGALAIPNGINHSAACTPGQIMLDTDAPTTQRFYACEGAAFVLQGGTGGGSSVKLDLADNAVNESTGITEIATTGDTNSIFTEPIDDKLLIAVGNKWPTAALADALSGATTDCPAGQYALGITAVGAGAGCTDATTEIDSIVATHDGDVAAHPTMTIDGPQLTTGTIPADRVGANYIDAVGEIASLGCTGSQILKRNALNNAWECRDAVQTTIAGAQNGHMLLYDDVVPDWRNVPMTGDATLTKAGLLRLELTTVELLTGISNEGAATTVLHGGAGTWSQIDMGDDTNLGAGRSLSESGDDIIADAELYTNTFDIVIETIDSGKDFLFSKMTQPITITAVDCIIDPVDAADTASVNVKECDATGDNCLTIDSALTCDNDGAVDAAITSPLIEVDKWLQIDSGSCTGTCSFTSVTITYTVDD